MTVRVGAPSFRIDIRLIDLVEKDKAENKETTTQWFEDAVVEKLRRRQPTKFKTIWNQIQGKKN